MITATSPQIRSATSPAQTARLVVGALVAVNLVIVEVLFATASPPANNILTALGRFFGLHLAFVMALQLLLVSRLSWLDRRIGFDRLTTWHRWTGLTLFGLVLLHATFVLLAYSRSARFSLFGFLGQTWVLLGVIAAGLLVATVAVSTRAVRRLLPYEVWRALHLLVYVIVGLGITHQIYEGTAFKTNTLTQVYWWGLWTFAVVALLTGRAILPVIRNARHRFTVAAVVPESADVVSVYTTGRHLDRLPARAGQFFLWRFPDHNGWWQVNPFSLSAAPDGRTLRLTAKGIGTTSRGLRDVPIGSRVFAEGPYGAFTTAQRTREHTLLIGGGIGITPIRSLLEDDSLTGDIVLLYRVRDEADAVLLGELRNLADTRGARLHVLTGRTGAGSPPNQPLSPESLHRLVPDVTERDVYVCGPSAMTDEVLRSLRTLGVPSRQVHAERFRLAS